MAFAPFGANNKCKNLLPVLLKSTVIVINPDNDWYHIVVYLSLSNTKISHTISVTA